MISDVFLPLILGLCLTAPSAESHEFAVRSTKYGDIRGFSMPFTNNDDMRLEVFMGVPYAEPPIGQKRWTRPEEPEVWNDDVRNATHPASCCVQPLANIRNWSFGPDFDDTDEDCLYLNVYSPRSVSEEEDSHPVLVWVHGGAHRYGCSDEYDGRILAERGSLTVVTINYRLGPFGFLSTEDEEAAGNYAFFDIILALKWVQSNIAQFGGDPSRVTVAGQSAGGALVSHLLFSPLTEGLFQRVIPQSGTALSPWAVWRPPYGNGPRHVAKQLAEDAGCPAENTHAMMQCLRGKSAELLINIFTDSGTGFNSPWIPRVDGDFMVDLPEKRLEKGELYRVDMLTGHVPDEFDTTYFGYPGIADGFTREQYEHHIIQWASRFEDAADIISTSLLHVYNAPGNDPHRFRKLLLDMRSNDGYHAPHDRLLHGVCDVTDNVYYYSFEYESEMQQHPDWSGVPHSEELNYLFGVPFWDLRTESCPWGCRNVVWYDTHDEWTQTDAYVSTVTMEAWTQFVHSGNPSTVDHPWATFDTSHQFYTVIDANVTSKQFYEFQRMSYMNDYRHKLLEFHNKCEDPDSRKFK